MTSTEDTQRSLKIPLEITPKTVSLLVSCGYIDYRSLAEVSPNTLLAQFATIPSLDKKLVEGYRRAARRMVWLATQENPEEVAKNCKDWTVKGLTAKGAWIDGYDDLTGNEVNERVGEKLRGQR